MKAKKFPPRFARDGVRGNVALWFQPYVKGERPKVESCQNYLIQPLHKGETKPRRAIGTIRVTSCIVVALGDVTQDEAQAAGYSDKFGLRRRMEHKINDGHELPDDTALWRIEWVVIQDDSRSAVAA